MKILLLSAAPNSVGGIAKWTEGYMNWFSRKANTHVKLVDTSLIGSAAHQVGKKRNFFIEIIRSLRIFFKMVTAIVVKRPNIVHLNTSCSQMGIFRDMICVAIANIFQIPIVIHCHCNICDQLGKNLKAKWAFQYILRHSRQVLVLNLQSLQYVKNLGCNCVQIVPNYIDTKKVAANHHISTSIQTALYVGHVCEGKGSFLIFSLAKKFPRINFRLIGPVAEEIRNKKRPTNCILYGEKDSESVIRELDNADVFIFPSYTEGFSNALLEAMARGVPVIATDVGANKDMLENKGGEVVAADDERMLYDSLASMNYNQERRRQMSNWNIKKVQTSYLCDSVMENLLEIYLKVAKC